MITKGLIVIVTQGFGNRLKAFVSSYIYAKLLKLPLYVCWEKDEVCNIDYQDVFEAHPEINTVSLNEVQDLKYCYFGRVHTNTLFDKIEQAVADTDNPNDYILIEGGHEFKHPSMNRLEFISRKQQLYTSLRFTEVIRSKVSEYQDKHKYNIGIHYRDVIPKYDDGDINNTDIVHFTKNSPLDSFYEIIKKIKSDNTNILIVSNTDTCFNMLQTEFPKLQFHRRCPGSERNTSNGMIDAIVDMLLLSTCDLIIGSYFSSFSDEASFFKLVPKITPLSQDRLDKINETVGYYHCHNYSYIDGYAALNYNDQILIKYLHI